MASTNKIKVLGPSTAIVDDQKHLITVQPDERLELTLSDTTAMSKEVLKDVQWVANMFHGKPNKSPIHSSLLGSTVRFRIPAAYAGGGLGWVEPIVDGDSMMYTPPHGYFICAIGPRSLDRVEWTTPKGTPISGDLFFGEAVQLHIYTSGLYGHDLQVRLYDDDTFSFNDHLTIAEDTQNKDSKLSNIFKREVKVYKDPNTDLRVQKVVIDIVLELRWMKLAGENLKIVAEVATRVKGVAKKAFKQTTLTVRKRKSSDRSINNATKSGNKPTIIGDVATDTAHFLPCRYEKITATLGQESPATLFSYPEAVNLEERIIPLNSIAHQKSDQKLTLAIESIDTDNCLFLGKPHAHEHTIIDTSALETIYKHDAGNVDTASSPQEISFIPRYPYKYLGKDEYRDFFVNYFPGFATPLEALVPIQSCAFDKTIRVRVFPDTAFAYHIHIGEPKDFTKQNKIYYRKIDMEYQMVRGLDKEMAWVRKQRQQVAKYINRLLPPPTRFMNDIIFELIFSYLELEAKKLAVGLHGYHTFTAPDQATVMNYGKKYKWIPITLMSMGLVITVAVEALMLYLTRGKSASAQGASLLSKARKAYGSYRKYKRYYSTAKQLASGQFVNPAASNYSQTQFVWPQISASRGIGYTYTEGVMGIEFVERLDAAPLFALDHKISATLGQLVAQFLGISKVFDRAEQAVGITGTIRTLTQAKDEVKERTSTAPETTTQNKDEGIGKWFRYKDMQHSLDALEKWLHRKIDKKLYEALGVKSKIELDFIGYYTASYEFKCDLLQKKMFLDIFEEQSGTLSFEDQQQLTFGRDYGIVAALKLEASAVAEQKWSKLHAYTPTFLGIPDKDTKIDTELKGEIYGSLNFEKTWSWSLNGNEPTVRDTLIFTGIAGSVYLKVKFEDKKKDGEWETTVEKQIGKQDPNDLDKKEPLHLELIPGFTLNLAEGSIFDKETWQNKMNTP